MATMLSVTLILVVLVAGAETDMPCLASDNKKWSTEEEKCVECSPCPTGKIRNSMEPYVGPAGPFGDTECLPCQECPPGSFAGELGCQTCVNCVKDFQREFVDTCGRFHDAVCGKCLIGYEDRHGIPSERCSLKQTKFILFELIRNNIQEPNNRPIMTDIDNDVQRIVEDNNSSFHVARAVITTISCIAIVIIAVFIVWAIRNNKNKNMKI